MEELINISIDKLLLDVKNPRIYKDIADNITQIELASYIYKEFGISDISDSIQKHGYFSVEPMVAIKADSDKEKYIVVEGNRRLTTIKILCDDSYRDAAISLGRRELYKASAERIKGLQKIPVVIANRREDVDAYLGVRHLSGIRPWDPLAQSKYVYFQIINKKDILGTTVKEAIDSYIKETSTKKTDVLSHFYKYAIFNNLSDIVEEDGNLKADFDNKFSYLEVAFGKTGGTSVAKYIGLDRYNKLDAENYDRIIPEEFEPKAKNLIKWVFTENAPIQESRQINSYLKKILAAPASTEAFENGLDKEEALLLSATYQEIVTTACQAVFRNLNNIDKNWEKINSDLWEELRKEYKNKVLAKVIQTSKTLGVSDND